MISKELLSKVMPEAQITKDGEIIIDYFFSERIERVNIYELAHKCKEWVYSQGIYISSGYADMDYDGDTCIASYSCYSAINLRCGYHSYNSKFDKDDWLLDYEFEGDTELEAIFKACQWILDNREAN